MKRNKKVCVIGAGVNGLSCAILLLKAGFDVTIISKDDPHKPIGNPDFASSFPSASIIPHSVFSDNLLSLLRESFSYFAYLYDERFNGIGINEHYELFCSHKNPPDYASIMQNFELFEDYKNKWHPSHPDLSIKSGWRFNCFFADWSLYFPALLDEFFNLGGKLQTITLDKSDLYELTYNIIVNCSGAGSSALFEDDNPLMLRGHLIHIENAPLLKNPEGKTVSYNFSSEEMPADVYCYPRQDGWILGGSRQQGVVDNFGNWLGGKIGETTKIINNIEVPSRILDYNRDIIRNSFDIDLDKNYRRTAKVGYRYIRDAEKGLRLEAEVTEDKLFIHNYGHGGAGVTLSWGCAKKVLSLVKQKIGIIEN